MADPITVSDKLKEVEREIGQRRRVYARLIAAGKLTQQKADRQIEIMSAVAADYRAQVGQAAKEGYLL